MSTSNDFSDDYVAQLLAKDAQAAAKKYAAYGLQELLPKRPTLNAPKPNKRFLKNIIKETDSHNAALRVKEGREAQARLKHLKCDNGGSMENGRGGRLPPEDDDRPPKRHCTSDQYGPSQRHEKRPVRSRSRDQSDYGKDTEQRRRRRRTDGHNYAEDETENSTSADHRDQDRDRHSHHRGEGYASGRKEHRSANSRSSPPRPRHYKGDRHQNHRARRRQDSKSDGSLELEKDSKQRKGSKRSPRSRRTERDPARSREASPAEDSDPLEAIIGPVPPPPQTKVKRRGRGTLDGRAISGMDTHFSSGYDPTHDAHPDPDVELDDWDQALEALQDRQRWQEKGAERLRAAGFSENEVSKWVSGKSKGQAVEKDEGDVRWKGRGEAREWDRGKVVTAEGIATEAEWGRLKGT